MISRKGKKEKKRKGYRLNVEKCKRIIENSEIENTPCNDDGINRLNDFIKDCYDYEDENGEVIVNKKVNEKILECRQKKYLAKRLEPVDEEVKRLKQEEVKYDDDEKEIAVCNKSVQPFIGPLGEPSLTYEQAEQLVNNSFYGKDNQELIKPYKSELINLVMKEYEKLPEDEKRSFQTLDRYSKNICSREEFPGSIKLMKDNELNMIKQKHDPENIKSMKIGILIGIAMTIATRFDVVHKEHFCFNDYGIPIAVNETNINRKPKCAKYLKEEEEHIVTLDVLYVRHMYSCANYAKKEQGSNFYWYISDPSLHCAGIKQAELLGKELSGIHFDMICSSQLFRAIQTGLIIRSQSKIPNIPFEVIPHINEKGNFMQFDNIPEKFKKITDSEARSINMTINRDESDKSNFKKYESDILPRLLYKMLEREAEDENEPKKRYLIMVVSHSSLLKEEFGLEELDNGQMILKQYDFSVKGRNVPLQLKSLTYTFDKSKNLSPYQNLEFYVDNCTICEKDISPPLEFLDFNKLKPYSKDLKYHSSTIELDAQTFESEFRGKEKMNVIWTTSGQEVDQYFFQKISDPSLNYVGIEEAKQKANTIKFLFGDKRIEVIALSKKIKIVQTAKILKNELKTQQEKITVIPFRTVKEVVDSSKTDYIIDEFKDDLINTLDVLDLEEYELGKSEERLLLSKKQREKEDKYIVDEIEHFILRKLFYVDEDIPDMYIFVVDEKVLSYLSSLLLRRKSSTIFHAKYYDPPNHHFEKLYKTVYDIENVGKNKDNSAQIITINAFFRKSIEELEEYENLNYIINYLDIEINPSDRYVIYEGNLLEENIRDILRRSVKNGINTVNVLILTDIYDDSVRYMFKDDVLIKAEYIAYIE